MKCCKYLLFLILMLRGGLSFGQLNCSMQADFSIWGFPDNATNVVLNINQDYNFKELVTCVCEFTEFTWYVTPASGGSRSGFTINGAYDYGYGTKAYPATIRFSVPGTYTVELKAVTDVDVNDAIFWTCGYDLKIKTKIAYITIPYSPPVAKFSTNGSEVASVNAALNTNVDFADISTNYPASWLWTITPSTGWAYSSGNATSKNPSIQFNTVGQYSVALKATNSAGNNTVTKTNHVNVTGSVPVADFSANNSLTGPVSSPQNVTVSFDDQSINNPASWLWTITPSTGVTFASGSASSPSPSIKFANIGNYTVSLKATNSLGSNTRAKANFISITPPAPIAVSNVYYCKNSTALPLSATGTNLKWYTSSSGGVGATTPITPPTSTVGSVLYYVTQTLSGVESPRTSIAVNTIDLPAAPSVTPVEYYCPTAPTRILSASGSNLKWYAAAVGGIGSSAAPRPSSDVVGITSYYVSQTNAYGCEGSRSEIKVEIRASLPAPVVTSPVSYCKNANATALAAQGEALRWYSVSTGGTAFTSAVVPNTSTSGTFNYYVGQNSTGCPESPRSLIQVIVSNISTPSAPTVVSPVEYYQGDSVTQPVVTGSNLLWYNSATGGVGSSVAPSVSSASLGIFKYYVSQTVNGCEGPRAEIVVTVRQVDPAPKWVWAKGDGFSKFVTDKDGNIYTINRDYNICNAATYPNTDLGVAKLDKNRNCIWGTFFKTNTTNSKMNMNDIILDAVGNIYVTGKYNGEIKFGDSIIKNSAGLQGFFVAKLNPSGKVLWVKDAKSTNTDCKECLSGNSIRVDNSSNIIVAGTFKNNITIGNTILTESSYTYSNELTMFFAKYDSIGQLIWAKKDTIQYAYLDVLSVAYPITIMNFAMAIDNLNNIYFTRTGRTTAFPIISTPELVKWNSSGTLISKRNTIGGISGLAIDLQNQVHAVGTAGNIVYTASGDSVWSNNLEGSVIVLDTDGNSYVAGNYTAAVNFGRYKFSNRDLYVAKYDPVGKVLWAQNSADSSIIWRGSLTNSIGLDKYENCYVSGKGTINKYLSSAYSQSGVFFIAKLGSGIQQILEFSPVSGAPGSTVTIKGLNLGKVDTVYFNGLPTTSFTIVSANEIKVIVPASATSGIIKLASAAGYDSTKAAFTVVYHMPDAPPDWAWAKCAGFIESASNGGYGKVKIADMASDAAGNVYLTGSFTGNLSFGDTLIISNKLTANAVFVSKLNANGKLIWIRKGLDIIPNPANDNYGVVEATKIKVHKNGNVYIAGNFSGCVYRTKELGATYASNEMVCSDASASGTARIYRDNFLLKFDQNGLFKFVKNIATGIGDERVTDLALDSTGNAYILGTYENRLSSSYPGRSASLCAGMQILYGNAASYLVKYDSSGNCKLGVDLRDPNQGYYDNEVGTSFAVQGNGQIILATKKYSYPGVNSNNIKKYSPSGILLYSNSQKIASDVSVDAADSRYLYGANDEICVSCGPGFSSAYVKQDVSLAKYDSAHNFKWTQEAGGKGADTYKYLLTDPAGNSYITGLFTDSIRFGAYTMKGNGNRDLFIAKYNSFGKLLWAQNAGSVNSDSLDAFVVDYNGNVYVAGTYNSQMFFGDIGLMPKTSTSNSYFYLAKLGANTNTSLNGGAITCPGGDATITSDLTGTNYQWQLNSGNGFVNMDDNELYTGTNTRYLRVSQTSSNWYNYQYRCIVDGVFSRVVELKVADTWVGTINTAWENSFNWSCTGKIPDENTDVNIPKGNVILNTNATIRSLNLNPAARLIITQGHILIIKESQSRASRSAAAASVYTSSVNNVRITTATGLGNVSNDGGSAILARGFVWGVIIHPTIQSSAKTIDGTGTGAFSSSLTGLNSNTTYYARAYATNSEGTSYGDEIVFTTLGELPKVVTNAAVLITSSTANFGGNVTGDGGSAISARGLIWSTLPNPTTALSTKTNGGTGMGTFASVIGGLVPNTVYYIRAFATNALGTVYGDELRFKTTTIPSVTTTAVSSITQYAASSGGNVTNDDGGATITSRGVVWSKISNPTVLLTTKTTDGAGVGNYTSTIGALTANSTYYVRAYATNGVDTVYGNQLVFTTPTLTTPSLTTAAISTISQTYATGGGSVTSDGGLAVTARGIVWSTSTNPTIALATKTVNGTGTGSFASSITGLVAGTTYNVRAYATNSLGTAYGNVVAFQTPTAVADNDGNSYNTAPICNQTWLSRNLNVSKYKNGDVIPQVTDSLQWASLTTGAWCYYNNVAANGTTYGKLYNWYAVTDPRGLAPQGYHISSDFEWAVLTKCLGGDSIAAGKLKSTGTSLWPSPNTDSDNSSGFTAFPGGDRGKNFSTDYLYSGIRINGYWWCSSDSNTNFAWSRNINYSIYGVQRFIANKKSGYSVRCLKDALPEVTTNAVSSIASLSASGGGNVIYDGGVAVTVRGIVWSTSANPTIALATKTADGTGTGIFSSGITGLSPNTTYYVRAYATNAIGTVYGNEINFITNAVPTPILTTNNVSSISWSTALCGGNIISADGATVIARGVVWSTSANPTIALDTKTTDGTGMGIFSSSVAGLSPGTSYYLRAYATNTAGTVYGNEVDFKTPASSKPALYTVNVSSITKVSASCVGNVTSDSGAAVTARGLVWDTNINPTIALTTKTTDGTGIGSFTGNMTGLTPSTTYYVRAYAINSVGIVYGNQLSFTTAPLNSVIDIDYNAYTYVTICNQTWTDKNLNVSKYTDGTVIPLVQDSAQWANLTTGAYCYYLYNGGNGPTWGKLYNWYAVAGIYNAASLTNASLRKQLAPQGWHIPSDAEWNTLSNCLNGDNFSGGKMKSTLNAYYSWVAPNNGATNSSGFSALPGGCWQNAYGSMFRPEYMRMFGYWWSSTEYGTALAAIRLLTYDSGSLQKGSINGVGFVAEKKVHGYSVRIVKD